MLNGDSIIPVITDPYFSAAILHPHPPVPAHRAHLLYWQIHASIFQLFRQVIGYCQQAPSGYVPEKDCWHCRCRLRVIWIQVCHLYNFLEKTSFCSIGYDQKGKNYASTSSEVNSNFNFTFMK